jgi:hypothetical protein
MEGLMSTWYRIWRRRREREDFKEYSELVSTPLEDGAFNVSDTLDIPLPAPGTLLIRASATLAAGRVTVSTGDGTTATHPALAANEVHVLGTFEESEEVTVTRNAGAFSGLIEIGVRDPAGRFRTIAELTCP